MRRTGTVARRNGASEQHDIARLCRRRASARRNQVTYQAPLADMGFALKYGAGLAAALEEGFFGELTADDVEAVLGEAGRIAEEVLAPLNRVGDRYGVTFKDGAVT